MEQTKSLFGPLLLIGAGAVWLLVSAGTIPSTNLWALTHVWPYLLIAAGAGLLLRSYWAYTSMLLDILIIGGVFLAILYAPRLGWANPSMISLMNNGEFYVGPGEPGSGNVVSQTREVMAFNAIEVDFPAEVFVSQGNVESVKVEAEDNVLPGLQTQVRNDMLRIFYESENGRHINLTRPVKVTIVVKDLQRVDFESAGDLTLNGIETDRLDISVSGAGNLKVNDLVTKKFSVDLSGAGSMSATGEADDFNLTISGFGSFDGRDLHTKTARANLSGAGSATLWVDVKLHAQLSGVGSVNYYGSPEVTKQVSGVGSVNRSGDK